MDSGGVAAAEAARASRIAAAVIARGMRRVMVVLVPPGVPARIGWYASRRPDRGHLLTPIAGDGGENP
jgi:hypothetical protein